MRFESTSESLPSMVGYILPIRRIPLFVSTLLVWVCLVIVPQPFVCAQFGLELAEEKTEEILLTDMGINPPANFGPYKLKPEISRPFQSRPESGWARQFSNGIVVSTLRYRRPRKSGIGFTDEGFDIELDWNGTSKDHRTAGKFRFTFANGRAPRTHLNKDSGLPKHTFGSETHQVLGAIETTWGDTLDQETLDKIADASCKLAKIKALPIPKLFVNTGFPEQFGDHLLEDIDGEVGNTTTMSLRYVRRGTDGKFLSQLSAHLYFFKKLEEGWQTTWWDDNEKNSIGERTSSVSKVAAVWHSFTEDAAEPLSAEAARQFALQNLARIEPFAATRPNVDKLPSDADVRVQLELVETGSQFTPNDEAKLLVKVSGLPPGRPCRINVAIEGSLVEYNSSVKIPPLFNSDQIFKRAAIWFGQCGSPVDTRLLNGAVETESDSTKSQFYLPLATDNEMNLRFYYDLFLVYGSARYSDPNRKIPLNKVFRVTVFDDEKELFNEMPQVTNGGAEASIAYPKFAVDAGMPKGISDKKKRYYLEGDTPWIKPTDKEIRMIALRAACYRRDENSKMVAGSYGKPWKHYSADKRITTMPETAAEAVDNIADYVFDSFFPKMWPQIVESPDFHAHNLLIGKHGPGKPMAPQNGKQGFACIEHSYFFGSLVRALGIPVREVNVLKYHRIWPMGFQDASSQAYFNGTWNYFSLFPAGGAFRRNIISRDLAIYENAQAKGMGLKGQAKETWSQYLAPPKVNHPIRSLEERYGGKDDKNSYYVFVGSSQYDPGINVTPTDRPNESYRFFGNITFATTLQSASWEYLGGRFNENGNNVIFRHLPLPNKSFPNASQATVITIHSPVAAALHLSEGRKIGTTSNVSPLSIEDLLFSSNSEIEGLARDVENATYLPEGTQFLNMALQPTDTLPQTLIVPGNHMVDASKLVLTATGNGPYRVEIAHLDQNGAQRYKTIEGTVKLGDRLEHQLDELATVGDRQPGNGADWLGLPQEDFSNLNSFSRSNDPWSSETNSERNLRQDTPAWSGLLILVMSLLLAVGSIGCLMLLMTSRGKKHTQYPRNVGSPVLDQQASNELPEEIVIAEKVPTSSKNEPNGNLAFLNQSLTTSTPIQLDSSFIVERSGTLPQKTFEFVLSINQIKTVLEIAGLVPDEASPLFQRHRTGTKEQPNIDSLIRQGIVIQEGGTLHVNTNHRVGFSAICHPDELVELHSSETPDIHFFARQLDQTTELTDLHGDKLRVTFPAAEAKLNGAILSYFAANGIEESQRRSQFMFTGSAAEIVVLSLVIGEALGRRHVNSFDLNTLVTQVLNAPEILHPFVASTMTVDLSELQPVEQAVPRILRSLVDRQYLQFTGEHFYPVPNVGHTFADYVDREMTIKRTLRTDAGFLTQQMSAKRISQSLIVMSAIQFPNAKETPIDWCAIAPESFSDYLRTTFDWQLSWTV